MFLTTEPNIQGQRYQALRVISGAGRADTKFLTAAQVPHTSNQAARLALADLENQAIQLGADAAIGVHLSISMTDNNSYAVVMGTAIKFQP